MRWITNVPLLHGVEKGAEAHTSLTPSLGVPSSMRCVQKTCIQGGTSPSGRAVLRVVLK